MKKIYFIIGEHRSITGINSYLKIFNQLLTEYNIVISNRFKKNAINILVENFNNKQIGSNNKFKKK